MKSYLMAFAMFIGLMMAARIESYQQVVDKALLEAQIHIDQGKELGEEDGKFQPGFPVQIKVKIKNSGTIAANPAKLRVRYALPKGYSNKPNSVLFETEVVELPSLAPGEEKEVLFAKPHQLPVLADFIRYDWPMRQYQAVLGEGGQEQIIGNLSLTYSAYYYEGPGKAFPTRP